MDVTHTRKALLSFCFAISLQIIFSFSALKVSSQNHALVINGAHIRLSGGNSTTPIYLVVNQDKTTGIIRPSASGNIISEGEYNHVKWNTRTTTGSYTVPFAATDLTDVSMVYNKTTAGTEASTGSIRLSSWYTAANATVPTTVAGVTMCPSEASAIDRFWLVTPEGYNASNYPTADYTFKYSASDLDGITEANLQAQQWDVAQTNCKWTNPPVGTVNVGAKTVTVSSVNSELPVPWTLSNNAAPLPIELLYFKARWKDENYSAALLEWETKTELNNEYFVIQRSIDAVKFDSIKTVPGNGTAFQNISYKDEDKEPITGGVSYYRLKQVDTDGTYSYSNIEALSTEGINIIIIYPNPVSGGVIDYVVSTSEDIDATIRLIDEAGRLIMAENGFLKKGVTSLKMNVSRLSNGGYTLQVFATDKNMKSQKQFLVR